MHLTPLLASNFGICRPNRVSPPCARRLLRRQRGGHPHRPQAVGSEAGQRRGGTAHVKTWAPARGGPALLQPQGLARLPQCSPVPAGGGQGSLGTGRGVSTKGKCSVGAGASPVTFLLVAVVAVRPCPLPRPGEGTTRPLIFPVLVSVLLGPGRGQLTRVIVEQASRQMAAAPGGASRGEPGWGPRCLGPGPQACPPPTPGPPGRAPLVLLLIVVAASSREPGWRRSGRCPRGALSENVTGIAICLSNRVGSGGWRGSPCRRSKPPGVLAHFRAAAGSVQPPTGALLGFLLAPTCPSR